MNLNEAMGIETLRLRTAAMFRPKIVANTIGVKELTRAVYKMASTEHRPGKAVQQMAGPPAARPAAAAHLNSESGTWNLEFANEFLIPHSTFLIPNPRVDWTCGFVLG